MENIIDTPTIVNKVSINGIKHTNHNFIKKQLESEELFKARSMKDVVNVIGKINDRLEKLEIFQNISIELDKTDTHMEDFANIHVIFEVEEKKQRKFSAKALCGLDNSVGLNLEMVSNNLFGRAEKLDVNYHSNLKALGGSSFSFFKPLEGFPQLRLGFGAWDNNFDHTWSRFLESTTGGFMEFVLKTGIGQHQCRFETMWREVVANSKAPLEVAKENGHSMKASVRHTFTRDTRDDKIYPERGYSVSMTQEMFSDLVQIGTGPVTNGALANVTLRLETELHKSLALGPLVLENTLGLGYLRSLTRQHTKVPIADRFFIGGPLGMRGFALRSLGPLSADGECSLGGETYMQHGAHVYWPLPFLGKTGDGFASLFRLHGFVTSAANLSGGIEGGDNWSRRAEGKAGGDVQGVVVEEGDRLGTVRSLVSGAGHVLSQIRCTAGFGIVFKLVNMFRLELNYCVPLRFWPGDKIAPGLQFGIGILYM